MLHATFFNPLTNEHYLQSFCLLALPLLFFSLKFLFKPDKKLGFSWIPETRLNIYAGYPALTGYPADHRISGYLGRKHTFCHNIFGTILYYALGAQITAPNFGFLQKIRRVNFVFSCLF